MTHHLLISVLAGALLCAAGGCQLHPRPVEAGNDILPPPPTPAVPYHVSDMRIQTLGANTFFYSSMRTGFQNMPGPAAQMIGSLQRLATSGQIRPAGPILFIYHDPSENPAEPFDLDIGIPVLNATPSLPDFTVRKLLAFHYATALYRGPMNLLPKAYDELIPEMIAAGFVPSEETRESYLVWDSPDSPNNVVQIEVGIRRVHPSKGVS